MKYYISNTDLSWFSFLKELEIFRERNGTDSYPNFRAKIQSYRGIGNSLNDNPNIGCLVLTNPVFFNENDWISIPENHSLNIVQGKSYSTDDSVGREYWK